MRKTINNILKSFKNKKRNSQKNHLFFILNFSFLIILLISCILCTADIYAQESQDYIEVTVDQNGEFSVDVPLEQGQTNNLVVISESTEGIFGDPVIITVEQVKPKDGLFTIDTPRPGITYANPSLTVMGRIIDPEMVKEIKVGQDKAALIGNYYARQVIFEEPGEHEITVTAECTDNTFESKTVGINYTPDMEGTDTSPPVITVLFPENGAVLNKPFVEIMGTVEENGTLRKLTANGVEPHSMTGNIFTVYAKLEKQGENSIILEATDGAGNNGSLVLNLVLDSSVPPAPVVNPVPFHGHA